MVRTICFCCDGGGAVLPFIKMAVMLSTSIEIMGTGARGDATTGYATGEGPKDSSILEDQDCNDLGEEKEGLGIPSKWVDIVLLMRWWCSTVFFL